MKRVVITGANQGIGYYMARKLLEDGNRVAVLDVETDGFGELKERYPDALVPMRCDMRDDAAVANAVESCVQTFGGIDIAVHNACVCTFESLAQTELSIYRNVMDVNFFGAVRLAKAALPHMERAGKGKIILTSSGVGVMGFVNISPYASSKGAIEAFAKCMNIEYQDKGVTFHIFHPPLTRTKSASGLPVPKEFMADPVAVGTGLARRIDKKSFVICHSAGQTFQTKVCYLFPLAMGRLMSKMTASAQGK